MDSWSLGCVFSEVAAWVVHGREGLEDYRQRRQDETQQLDDFRDGKAFHDGEAMLQCVGKMHNKVLQNKRFSDNVTGPVIETMITEMLDESEGRPNAKQLWAKSQRILRAAETKLKSTEWDPTENDKQHAKKVPPVTPPDLPHSQSERSGRRGVPRELSLAKQQLPIRSATYNVLAPEHTTSSPQPQEYDSPEDIDSTDPTPPTSPGDIQNGTNNQHQRLPSHPDPYRPGSLLERNQVIDDSPTPYSKFRKRGSARYGLRGSNHAHDQSLSGSMLGSNIRELNETSPMLALAEHQSSPHTPSDSWQRQPGHRIPNLTTSPRLAQRRVGRELPHLSIAEAEKWIFYTKQHGKSYPALEHKELLDELNRRDHVCYIAAPTKNCVPLTAPGIPGR